MLLRSEPCLSLVKISLLEHFSLSTFIIHSFTVVPIVITLIFFSRLASLDGPKAGAAVPFSVATLVSEIISNKKDKKAESAVVLVGSFQER